MHPSVHCSTIYSSQDTEATYMSIFRGIKMWYIYAMEYYSVTNKEIMFAET